MKNFTIILVICLLCGFWGREADACSYQPLSFEESFEAAPTVFIGHVVQVRRQQVTFAIDKGIKGHSHRKRITIQKGASTCHIDFKQGTYWLYMGEQTQHGSMLLFDEFGRPVEPAASIVKSKFAYDIYTINPTVFPAIAVVPCATKDKGSFFIRLKNGLTANIFTSLKSLEGREDSSEFRTVNEKSGGAVLYSCDINGKNCGPRLNGQVEITVVNEAVVQGYVEILDSAVGSKERFNFEADRLPDTTLCK